MSVPTKVFKKQTLSVKFDKETNTKIRVNFYRDSPTVDKKECGGGMSDCSGR